MLRGIVVATTLLLSAMAGMLADLVAQGIDEVPAAVWLQYPVVLIVLAVIFYMLREFKAFIKERDTSWQKFLEEHAQTDQTTLKEMVAELKALTRALGEHDHRLEAAVTRMEERTRPRGERDN